MPFGILKFQENGIVNFGHVNSIPLSKLQKSNSKHTQGYYLQNEIPSENSI